MSEPNVYTNDVAIVVGDEQLFVFNMSPNLPDGITDDALAVSAAAAAHDGGEKEVRVIVVRRGARVVVYAGDSLKKLVEVFNASDGHQDA